MLAARFAAHRGSFALSFECEVERGQVVAVVGESGAGKTTALRCVAGLQRIESGIVRCGEAVWSDAGAGTHIPAYRRDIAFVFTRPALFGHMSALENAEFGLLAAGIDRNEAFDRARAALDVLEAGALAARRASQLSSGEAQRIALARAVALRPAVLLLDEPLASLDARLRPLVRDALRTTIEITGAATLLVTHEPEEAQIFTDAFIVIENGAVVQRGRARDLANAPATDYVRALGRRVTA